MTIREVGELARLHLVDEQGVAVATVDGEIDLSNAARLVEQLRGAVEPAAVGLVVDLSDTEYIDSAGIRSLFEIGRHTRQRRQLLGLVLPAESLVHRVLEATGVQDAIPFYDDRTSAIADLRHRQRGRPPAG